MTSPDVRIVGGGDAIAAVSAPTGASETGERGEVRGNVTCAGGTQTVTVAISATGDGVAVDAERDVSVTCATPTP